MEPLFSVTILIAAVTIACAQFPSYFSHYPAGSSESAVSLNNAPVGIYGRKINSFSGSSEIYGASLGGAKVGIYNKQDQLPQTPQTPPFYGPFIPWSWSFFPFLYPYGFPQFTRPYGRPSFGISPSQPSKQPSRDFNAGGVTGRSGALGAASAASAVADLANEKTKADASSLIGAVSADVIRDIFG